MAKDEWNGMGGKGYVSRASSKHYFFLHVLIIAAVSVRGFSLQHLRDKSHVIYTVPSAPNPHALLLLFFSLSGKLARIASLERCVLAIFS